MKISIEKILLGITILVVGYIFHIDIQDPYVFMYRLSQYVVMITAFLFMAFRWTGDPKQTWSNKKRWAVMGGLWLVGWFLISLTFIMYSQLPNNEAILLPHLFLPWVADNCLEALGPGLILGMLYGFVRKPILTGNKRKIKMIVVGAGTLALIYGAVYFWNVSYEGNKTVQFLDKDQQMTSLKQVLARPELQGRKVYVDLWFSTCGPCIESFQRMRPGKEILQQSEVTILYLGRETSHLNSKQKWMNVIKEYNLEGYHVYMSKELEEDVYKQVGEHVDRNFGYPHYLTVNDKGKVISWDAPAITKINELSNAITDL